MAPMPKKVLGETSIRWGTTTLFAACTGALMWTLGVSLSPTAGLTVGVLVFGVVTAVLWGRYLEDVRDERTRASSGPSGHLPFRAEVDEDTPAPQPAPSTRSNGYYDDEDD